MKKEEVEYEEYDWEERGRTEVIMNNPNPIFITSFLF